MTWVKHMGERAQESFEAPRRITLPMIALIAAVSASATYGANWAFSHQQQEENTVDIKDLKPRVRQLEDDRLKEGALVAYLQTTIGETRGSLETGRKDVGDRLLAVEKQLAALNAQISVVISAASKRQ